MINSKQNSVFKKFLSAIFLSFLILAINFLAVPVSAQNKFEPDATTVKCASHLFGTMSKDDCTKTCKTGANTCKLMTKVNGAGGEVDDCYVCPYDLTCHEIGLDDWVDCFNCDLNPKTECIAAGWMPPGGFPGAPGGGPIGGKTPGGTQCYDCVPKTDKCPAPSSWLATCQANCAAPKQCMFSGVDANGFNCFTCKDNKADSCKDLGMLSNADCAACNAKPNMQCVMGGFTKNFTPCFQCVAKKKPPVPDTCQDYGMEINCNPCIAKGMGCNWFNVDQNLTCAWCYNKKEVKSQCQPPDFDSSGCKACEKDGGVCIGRTTVRGETPCYYCYKQITEKVTGCKEYGLSDSCTPNPCFENEACTMFPMDDKVECAICSSTEDWIGGDYCADHKLQRDCATCYRSHMACRPQFVAELGSNCYECYWPREPETCEEMGWPGDCEPNPCHEGQTCVPYEVKKGLYCATCMMSDEVVCPEGTQRGRCSQTSCPSYQGCYEEYGCYECYDKQCSDFDLEKDCKYCESQGKDCKPVSPHPNFNCFQCVDKIAACPIGSIPGGCSEGSCSSSEVCIPGGGDCHECKPDIKEKFCLAGSEPGACTSGSCGSGETCTPSGEGCHSCEPKKTVEDQCKQGFLPGTCTSSSCSSDQECVADGNCHSCQPKKIKEEKCKDGYAKGSCSPNPCGPDNCIQDGNCFVCERNETQGQRCDQKGLLYADGCNTCLEFGKNCVAAGPDDFGIQCFQCADKPVTQEDRCNAGFAPGKCLSISCSTEERCEEDTKAGQKVCHKCVPLKTTTGRQCNSGMFPGTCPGVCADKNLGCAPSGLGDGCYYCTYKETRAPCPIGEWFGTCPANCKPVEEQCIQDGVCYFCDPNPTYTQPACPSGEKPGTCPGDCGSSERCFPSETNPNCYSCFSTTTKLSCPSGKNIGSCPGICATFGQKCVQDPQKHFCYSCEDSYTQPPTEPKKSCASYDLMESCTICGWRGMACQHVSPEIGMNCVQCVQNACRPHLTEEECGRCYYSDADCMPVDKNGRFYPKGMTVEKGPGPQCYECDYGERCSDYGLVCNCSACPRGTMCVPTTDRLYDGKPCYACVKGVKKQGDYVIILIEPMYERYVLKDTKGAAGGLGDFVGRKVMALAKVDDVNGIKQIAGFLKGGLNPASIIPVNMESLTSTLQQAVASGGKFTDNCFKDFQAADISQKLPAGTKTSDKKKKNEAAPQVSEGYGENPLANATITGPVFACGESAGKKALMVLDAGGNPAGIITQDIAKKSPEALKNVIEKAQGMSDAFLELKQGGWQGMVKKFVGSLIDRGANKVEEVVKDKKKKKSAETGVQTDPNDPVYAKPEKGEKKKFLGVFGGDSPDTPVIIGSGMKFGGRVLGGGADVHKDKEPKTDYQWGLYKIGFTPKSDPQSAWNAVNADEKNVIVAVVDSGLDLNHPDGPRYIWKNPDEIPDNGIDDDNNGYIDDVQGWNFLDNNNDLRDFRGHGTFVAGIIAARTNNGQGIAGINPGAVIMPLKVANDEGEANSFNIYRAINYAVSHGARVINVSLGAHGQSLMEQSAINYAREMGVFISVAAGNVNENIDDHGPASSLGAFAVGAIDISGERSTISNWGGNNGLLAPAEEIYSLLSSDAANRVLPSLRKLGYYTQSGTSFSSPMVAATASLILIKHPNYTPADIEDVLQRTATDMYEEGWDGKSGAGVLNAAAALRDEAHSNLTVKLNALKKNLDDSKKFDSIDVTATVRGDLDQFTIGVGRGIHPGSFKTVAGPFKKEADNDWVARISEDDMRGSTDWVIKIEATDRTGKKYSAESAVDLKEK